MPHFERKGRHPYSGDPHYVPCTMPASLFTFSYRPSRPRKEVGLITPLRLTERSRKLCKVTHLPNILNPPLALDSNMRVSCSSGAGETPGGILKRKQPALVPGGLGVHTDKVGSGWGLQDGGAPHAATEWAVVKHVVKRREACLKRRVTQQVPVMNRAWSGDIVMGGGWKQTVMN